MIEKHARTSDYIELKTSNVADTYGVAELGPISRHKVC
jgi:hypothetical protein